jgi:type IV fimbrial biogenesis protein FimT
MMKSISIAPKRYWGKALNSVPCRGFTLIELMVTIAIMAILLMIAVPSFSNATLGSKLSAYANSLAASAHLARSEAIKRNAPVELCVSSNGTSCATSGGWEQGWIVRAANETVIQYQQALPTGLKILSGTTTSVNFAPSGVGANIAATFTVCRATPTVGAQERVVSITATGRPSVKKTNVGACA